MKHTKNQIRECKNDPSVNTVNQKAKKRHPSHSAVGSGSRWSTRTMQTTRLVMNFCLK